MTDSSNTSLPAKDTASLAPDPRPEGLPDKFWDAEAGTVRLDALIKSYNALEKKLSQKSESQQDEGEQNDAKSTVVPADYCIACDHGYFTPDPDLNKRFQELGLTQDQAQAVYDAAAEKLVPLVLNLAADAQAEAALQSLIAEFGGPDKWREMARQMLAFGRKNMPEDVLQKLASAPEGIRMLHKMMQAATPAFPFTTKGAQAARGADHLYALMRDPKYWRDHDPALTQKVADGFAELYG